MTAHFRFTLDDNKANEKSMLSTTDRETQDDIINDMTDTINM